MTLYGPECSGKVPERDRLAVGNEVGLAVSGVRRLGGIDGKRKEFLGTQDMRPGCVNDICEVEEVAVVSNLELGLASGENLKHSGKELSVPGPGVKDQKTITFRVAKAGGVGLFKYTQTAQTISMRVSTFLPCGSHLTPSSHQLPIKFN